MQEFTLEECQQRQKEVLLSQLHKAKLPMLERSIAARSNSLTATGTRSNVYMWAPFFPPSARRHETTQKGFLWQDSVVCASPKDFYGALHLHLINVRVAIQTTSGIVGSNKVISSQVNSVERLVTGGRMLNMIFSWLNKWRTTR